MKSEKEIESVIEPCFICSPKYDHTKLCKKHREMVKLAQNKWLNNEC